MAGVHKELVGEGRGCHEYDYIPFSDPAVVTKLIMRRSKLDQNYYPLMRTANPVFETDGVPVFSELVVCTYLDLDRLIEQAGLSPGQRRVVDYLMRGYCGKDIADHLGVVQQNVPVQLQKAVKKIVAANRRNWEECYGRLSN